LNSSGNSVCRRNATITASSSDVSTVDLASFGPVGRSVTDVRWRHFDLPLVFHPAATGA